MPFRVNTERLRVEHAEDGEHATRDAAHTELERVISTQITTHKAKLGLADGQNPRGNSDAKQEVEFHHEQRYHRHRLIQLHSALDRARRDNAQA